MARATRIEGPIRASIVPGQLLWTRAQHAQFRVQDVRSDAIVLLLGVKEAVTTLPWRDLEAALDTLPRGQWVEVGAGYRLVGEPGTLDGALKQYVNRAVASYVAALLVEAQLADVDGGRPLRIKLKDRA